MSMFFNRKKPLLKSERYYEDEPVGIDVKKYIKFSVFVGVALILVVAVILSMFAINYKNNTFVMFNKASSKNFDCGSFSYEIQAGINDDVYMDYDGAIEFDLNDRSIESKYHAVYKDYEYDAVTYAKNAKAYRGNYYEGKWTIEDYTEKSLDFYSFYLKYRRGSFNASAATRFTQTNRMFNSNQLKLAVNNIADELMKPSNARGVLHQQLMSENGETKVTFNPEMDKVFDVIIDNIGPAYTSAGEFTKFKADVENSVLNLQSTDVEVTYTINEKGYLSYVYMGYEIEGDNYFMEVRMDDFKEAQAEIPESFFTAAGIEK